MKTQNILTTFVVGKHVIISLTLSPYLLMSNIILSRGTIQGRTPCLQGR